MLVLSRKVSEKILIEGNIVVTVLGIQGRRVRLGIEAPSDVGIVRQELQFEAEGGSHALARLPTASSELVCS
jgi:carbon storage regulator